MIATCGRTTFLCQVHNGQWILEHIPIFHQVSGETASCTLGTSSRRKLSEHHETAQNILAWSDVEENDFAEATASEMAGELRPLRARLQAAIFRIDFRKSRPKILGFAQDRRGSKPVALSKSYLTLPTMSLR